MPENIFPLNVKEQEAALQVAASAEGRPLIFWKKIFGSHGRCRCRSSPHSAHISHSREARLFPRHAAVSGDSLRMLTSLTTIARSRLNGSGISRLGWHDAILLCESVRCSGTWVIMLHAVD